MSTNMFNNNVHIDPYSLISSNIQLTMTAMVGQQECVGATYGPSPEPVICLVEG